MVAFVERIDARPESISTPHYRVRKHLHMVNCPAGGAKDEWHLAADIKDLIQRLGRVQSRSGFEGVELSPHLTEVAKALKVVGCELLTLTPERIARSERKGA